MNDGKRIILAAALISWLGASGAGSTTPGSGDWTASEIPPGQAKKDAALDVDLAALLAKAAEYCRKLEGAALDYICAEEIVETINPSLEVKQPMIAVATWTNDPGGAASSGSNVQIIGGRSVRKAKRTLLYDYQLIRKAGTMVERRTLLREDRKKLNEPDAKLKTSVLLFETLLLGPAGLFSERIQPNFDYAVVGKEKVDKKPVVIVEATPKPDAPPAKELYGKAWIDPTSGDIVKIEWSPSRVGHFEVFEKRGEKFGLKPRLTLTSEFEEAKNGLRFPTRFLVEEAYLNTRNRAFVRSTTEVTYKDFKFFTVEVDVR